MTDTYISRLQQTHSQIRMLCLFDYGEGVHTGYATVARNLVQQWKKYYGKRLLLDIIGINYFGQPYREDDCTAVENALFRSKEELDKFPEFIDPEKKFKNDEFGGVKLLKMLSDNDYDIVFILNDLGIISNLSTAILQLKNQKKAENRKSFKTIVYFPVDTHLFERVLQGLHVYDELVTYTEFGRREVLTVNPKLKPHVIPHGTNLKDFYPLPMDEIHEFRHAYFGKNASKFIVANINRNQPRKDIPTTILGFIAFHETHPDSLLYLHMNPMDGLGYDLRLVLQQTPLIEGKDFMFPPKDKENHGTSIEELNKIYNSIDCYLTTNKGEGWGLCLHPSTEITTSNGCVQISEMVNGIKVLGNDGLYHSVLDTTCRVVNEYIHLKAKYGYNVKATHEHPYFVLSEGKEVWKKAGLIKKGDYIGIVKPKINNSLIEKIDLAYFLPENSEWQVTDDKIFSKHGYSPKSNKWSYTTIISQYGATKKVAENARAYIEKRKKNVSKNSLLLADKLLADGYIASVPLEVNRFLNITDDLLQVFGWYLAEGSNEGGQRVEFSLSGKVKKSGQFIKNTIENSFGIKDVVLRPLKNKYAVRVSNKVVAHFFKIYFGDGAYHKRIPQPFVFSPKNMMPLVKGYISGDGHMNLQNDFIGYTTVSPSLAFQIQSILASNNIFVSVHKRPKGEVGNYPVYNCIIASSSLQKYLDLTGTRGVLDRTNKRNHRPDFIETENHFFIPFISSKTIEEKIEVYDLCVEGTHSFVGNGIVCHNTVTEAMRSKVPVIAPMHTSIPELSQDGKNIWKLEEFDRDCQPVDNMFRYKCIDYDVHERLEELVNTSAEEVQEKVERAYEFISSITWEKSAGKFIEIINSLL